jgi:hypothetical protein
LINGLPDFAADCVSAPSNLFTDANVTNPAALNPTPA